MEYPPGSRKGTTYRPSLRQKAAGRALRRLHNGYGGAGNDRALAVAHGPAQGSGTGLGVTDAGRASSRARKRNDVTQIT